MDVDVQTWIAHCSLPDDTELQEHTLKTGHNIVIGDRCQIDYGLEGSDIVICELCKINGNILSTGDIRLDNWCEVSGDVIVEEDAFIGEGVKIQGKLIVRGDLDIGDNVQIAKGFEAKGWINIRNPMPVIMYLLLYLLTMLKLEKGTEVESMLEEMFGEEEVEATPLRIPPGTILNMQTFAVSQPMEIGSGCRLHGNIRAETIEIKENTTVFGSLRSVQSITIGGNTTIHGDVACEGDVVIRKDAHILGNAISKTLVLHEDARIDGMIKAPNGLRIERET